MEAYKYKVDTEFHKLTKYINVTLATAMLFLSACNAEATPAPTATPTPQYPLIPERILCPNYQDYVDVQLNGLWKFVDVEDVNGQEVVEFTKEDINSYSEAISNCNRDDTVPSTLP